MACAGDRMGRRITTNYRHLAVEVTQVHTQEIIRELPKGAIWDVPQGRDPAAKFEEVSQA